MSRLEELLFVFGGALLALTVGAVYLRKADGEASWALRLSTSAYAPSLALLFLVSGFLWPEQWRFTAEGKEVFLWLQVVPAMLLLFALAKYPGPKKLHLALVPVSLVAWLWTFTLGWFAVNGK